MKWLDENSAFSWRKALTAMCGLLYAFAVVGHSFGLPEMPAGYLAVIVMVFAFYFAKDKLRTGEPSETK